MNKIKRSPKLRLVSWEEHRKQLMKDPEFVKAWQELQPEFEIIEKIIRARLKRGVTQKKLAQRMKTKQSAISRLESGTANPSLNFLKRLAEALDSRLEIKLVPK
ncbi:helix-turn-helix domain-containing protein [Patescibacteria group bacterium]|nr:helix-turn-helix domain-containing protein [Patescibacteria group bacterium]